MALTNKQYDAIMRSYDQRQYRDYRKLCARQDEIYQAAPRIREIEEEISAQSLTQAERAIDGDPKALKRLQAALSSLRQEKELLLQNAGYPADYLEMHYVCPDCRDTGYIGRRKCHCFRREEIALLYSSSRLESVLEKENFSTLSCDVYDEEQKTAMPAVIKTCRDFAAHFDDVRQSLLFYGPVGTGKTFLTNCIAKELLDSGHSVIYFTAFQFFEQLSARAEDAGGAQEAILQSDLLILDDLGTELANTFTVSRLFQVLNERAIAGKSTILSTNLSLRDFRDVYSERVFSRITSFYTLVKFTGSDIRIRRKLTHSG